VTAIDDLVLLSGGFLRADVQLGHAQSHSGTPPMEAVPSTVISMT
jgi:hypothetical protein